MTDLAAATVPYALFKPIPTPTAGASSSTSTSSTHPATAAQRAAIKKTAQDFEASFLSTMFGEMFEGTEVSAPFGGGQAEDAFRSFFTDAMAKQMSKGGGIGVAASVQREMLRMQGLS